jgi:antitoxin FitA
MQRLVIDGIEDDELKKLQRRAERNGRSLQEEVREILRDAVKSEPAGLGTLLAERFRGIGLEQEIQELRGYPAEPADFDDQS